MPLVEGESLYERLQRERRLPVPEALAIARDVATALGYAHERGVLHRDVKPENILLAGGRALIADFGLARAIGAADYTKLTATGVIVGTVYYMSPEQLREERDLDQRTDIYSLGCILYEMLSGEPPFTGRTLTEVANRILRGPIPAVRRLRPEVPGAGGRGHRPGAGQGSRGPLQDDVGDARSPPRVTSIRIASARAAGRNPSAPGGRRVWDPP